MVYEIENAQLTKEILNLRRCLSSTYENEVVSRCQAQREKRVQMCNDGTDRAVNSLI